jgi:hypothetical protein
MQSLCFEKEAFILIKHFKRKIICANVGWGMVPNRVGEHEKRNVLSEVPLY